MATDVYVKFNYDRLRIDKALGNWTCDNNKHKNNVRSACMGTLAWCKTRNVCKRESETSPSFYMVL